MGQNDRRQSNFRVFYLQNIGNDTYFTRLIFPSLNHSLFRRQIRNKIRVSDPASGCNYRVRRNKDLFKGNVFLYSSLLTARQKVQNVFVCFKLF